jgi:GNAT superfamily N-acetyltransferase
MAETSIEIREVGSKSDLKKYIRFNYLMYKNCPYAVPDLLEDTLDTFNPKKNAAFEFCDVAHFLAYRDNKIVGRVTAIINKKANATWNTKVVRFGWIDFIDDPEVSKALLSTVEKWGKERGMEQIEGPLGFTDMDPEGMLTWGYDQLGTMATIYNFPYYPQHMEQHGFGTATDWIERKIFVPTDENLADSAKYFRVAKMSAERYHLRVKKLKNMKEIKRENYGQKIFNIINEAYAPLFGYSAMNEKQIDQYVKMYLPLVDLRMETLVVNEDDEVVAVGLSMPSLSRAIQKAKGRLFPFGWYHLAKALFFKHSKTIDLLLIAVKPEYQNKGVNAILFADLIPIFQKMGFTNAESNPQLDTNEKSKVQWIHLDNVVHKRRRCYVKDIKIAE